MATNVAIEGMNEAFANIEKLQVSCPSAADPDLSVRLFGGKDEDENVIIFLAKDKPALVSTLKVSSFTSGILKSDAFGVISPGTLVANDVPNHDDLNGLNALNYKHLTDAEYNKLPNWDTAYTHSQVVTGNPHNVLATQITDFDTEVSNNSSVVANTAKVTNATHTGDVTGATALTIANDVVSNSKLANMVGMTVKMNSNIASSDPEDISIKDLAEKVTPVAGDYVLAMDMDFPQGYLRKMDVASIAALSPGANIWTAMTNEPTGIKTSYNIIGMNNIEVNSKWNTLDTILTGGGAINFGSKMLLVGEDVALNKYHNMYYDAGVFKNIDTSPSSRTIDYAGTWQYQTWSEIAADTTLNSGNRLSLFDLQGLNAVINWTGSIIIGDRISGAEVDGEISYEADGFHLFSAAQPVLRVNGGGAVGWLVDPDGLYAYNSGVSVYCKRNLFEVAGVINNSSNTTSFNIANAIKIGSVTGTEADGMIRWTGSDFEGRVGATWTSFTGASNWNIASVQSSALYATQKWIKLGGDFSFTDLDSTNAEGFMANNYSNSLTFVGSAIYLVGNNYYKAGTGWWHGNAGSSMVAEFGIGAYTFKFGPNLSGGQDPQLEDHFVFNAINGLTSKHGFKCGDSIPPAAASNDKQIFKDASNEIRIYYHGNADDYILTALLHDNVTGHVFFEDNKFGINVAPEKDWDVSAVAMTHYGESIVMGGGTAQLVSGAYSNSGWKYFETGVAAIRAEVYANTRTFKIYEATSGTEDAAISFNTMFEVTPTLCRYNGVSIVNEKILKVAYIENPTAGDNIAVFKAPANITLQEVIAVGNKATSLTFSVKSNTQRDGGGTAETNVNGQTCNSSDGGNSVTIANATIESGDWVYITIDTVSTAPDDVTIQIRYTED